MTAWPAGSPQRPRRSAATRVVLSALSVLSVLVMLGAWESAQALADPAAACPVAKLASRPDAATAMAAVTRNASSADIRAFVRQRGARVLTLVGYSGAGYQDPAAMLAAADAVLSQHDPLHTLVNIGATAQGIGAAYVLARQRGFTTIGIVSSLARDEQVALSPCVDLVFFVADSTWGGRLAGKLRLAPTSAALVANSDDIVAIGGGDIARDELLAARRRGKPVRFIPADMDHQAALEKARTKGQPVPTNFQGALHAALAASTTPTTSAKSNPRAKPR